MAVRQARPVKLCPPEARGIMARPRLYRMLDRAPRAVWIWGPPGAGKTSLVGGYAASRRLPVGWYQVERGDGDLATFIHYVGLLDSGRDQEPSPAVSTGRTELLEAVARRSLDRLLRRAPEQFVLVLEDFHQLPSEAPLRGLVQDLLASIPAGRRIIVTSRGEPDPLLARLRANGLLATIGWDDLRLTWAEARAIARGRIRGRGSLPRIENAIRRADGWAAGLTLLLHSKGPGGPDGVGLDRSVLFDYFAAEVLSALGAERCDALVALSVLLTFDADTATELTGQPWIRRLLDELASSHRFVDKLGGPNRLYRFHPLFRDFLRARAGDTLPEAALNCARRAAARLARLGQVEEAVALFTEARAWDELERMIVEHAPALVRAGRERTLNAWLSALPPTRIESAPWLAFWRGVAELPHELAGAREHLARAVRGFEETADPGGEALALAQILDSYFLEWGRYRDIDPWIDRVEACIAGRLASRQEVDARLLISAFRAMFYRQPDHPRMPWLRDQLHAVREDGKNPAAVGAGLVLAFHYSWIGQPGLALRLVQTAQEQARAMNVPVLLRQTADYMEALVALKLGDGPGCLRAAQRGLDRAQETEVHVLDFRLHSMRVYGAMTARDGDLAARHLEWMRQRLDSAQMIDVGYYHFLTGWHAAVYGNLPRAERHATAGLALAEEAGMLSLISLAAFLSAQLARERGDVAGAERHLSQMRGVARAMHSESLSFMADLCDVDLHLARGDGAGADALLHDALARGRERQLSYYGGWRPTVMTRLCARALAQGIEVPYVRGLIRAQGLAPEEPPLDVPGWPWPIEVRALGALRVGEDGRELRWTGKAQQRPLDLLRAVIALGGRHVPLTRAIDALWPEAEGDAGRAAFDTTVLRLRRLLKHPEAIVVEDGRIGLDERVCWVDVWALERALDRAERLPGRDAALQAPEHHLRRALDLYQGPLLDDSTAPWVIPPRERLRARLARRIDALARDLEAWGRIADALEWYLRGVEVDSLAEGFYRSASRCCRALGRDAEGHALLHRCRQVLDAEPGQTLPEGREVAASAGGRLAS